MPKKRYKRSICIHATPVLECFDSEHLEKVRRWKDYSQTEIDCFDGDEDSCLKHAKGLALKTCQHRRSIQYRVEGVSDKQLLLRACKAAKILDPKGHRYRVGGDSVACIGWALHVKSEGRVADANLLFEAICKKDPWIPYCQKR